MATLDRKFVLSSSFWQTLQAEADLPSTDDTVAG